MNNEKQKLFYFNQKLCRIFRKIDKSNKGFITKYQIQFSFPREEREEILKRKIVKSLSECTSAGHYLDLYGFIELVHLLITLGLYHI